MLIIRKYIGYFSLWLAGAIILTHSVIHHHHNEILSFSDGVTEHIEHLEVQHENSECEVLFHVFDTSEKQKNNSCCYFVTDVTTNTLKISIKDYYFTCFLYSDHINSPVQKFSNDFLLLGYNFQFTSLESARAPPLIQA